MRAAPLTLLVIAVGLLGFDVVNSMSASAPVETWTVDTTPRFKGHPQRYPNAAVCVSSLTEQTRTVAISTEQIHGNAQGAGFLAKGDPCPR